MAARQPWRSREMSTRVPTADRRPIEKRTLLLTVAGAVFVADRLTKVAVVGALAPWERSALLGDVVWITHVTNPGTALGLWSGERVLVIALMLVSLSLLALLYRFLPRHSLLRLVAVALAIGGALGNLLDRLVSERGVVDFIEIHAGSVVLPVFNLADVAVLVGAFALAGSIWRDERALA